MRSVTGSLRPQKGARRHVVPVLFAAVLGLAPEAAAAIRTPAQPQLSAVALPDLPVAREGAAAASTDDALYVAGGEGQDGLCGRVDVLDLKTGRWRTLTTLATARRDLGAAIVGRTLVLVGGRNAIGAAPEVERIDLDSGRITLGQPLPTPRAHAGVAAHGDEVVVAGGTLGWGRMRTVEIYDVARDRWFRGPDLGEARDATLVSAGGELFALGGFVKKGEVSTRVERLTRGGWIEVSRMPAPTSGFAAVAVGGHILTFGDWADPGRVLSYDLGTGRWSWLRGPYAPRRRAAAAALGGYAVVVGGSLHGAPLGTTEALRLAGPGAS
jgi:hypothetical protein